MIKNLTKNLGIKIFCLLMATFLWVYVAAGQSSVGKFPGSIKIRAVNVPSGLVAVYDTKTVDIKVMADPAILKKLSADSFSAYIDLSARSEGTYEIPVVVTSTEAGVSIVEKTPEKMFVRLESISSKEVGINKKVEGSAAEGLVVGGVEIDPEQVTARGPKSIIDSLTEATIDIKLNGESEDFTKTYTITALDEKGEVINGVEFAPTEVKAKVLIAKASNNKTVGVKVVTTGSPKSGYFVSSITTTPSVIDILGPRSILNDINYVETTPLDLTNLSADVEKELSLSLNNGIVLQNSSPAKVKVKIKISEAQSTRELVAEILPRNLNGYTITGYSVNQVKVIVSGPSSTLQGLKSSDVNLVLDFSGKYMGDNVSFELSSVNFNVPSGISIVSFLPSSITATLKKP